MWRAEGDRFLLAVRQMWSHCWRTGTWRVHLLARLKQWKWKDRQYTVFTSNAACLPILHVHSQATNCVFTLLL